jgi:putative FmdB family regulatory protein
MPLYKYRCACGNEFEQRHEMQAAPAHCSCGEQAKKVFGLVGVAFKGKGFYSTDKPAVS